MRVTEALTIAGLIDPTWYSSEAAQRGTAVHAATALDDLGDLDESSVDPIVAPYLASWRKTCANFGWRFGLHEVEVELRLGSLVGHVDRIIYDRAMVIDIKTGSPEPWHRIQTALYASMTPWSFVRSRRLAVYLDSEGGLANVRTHKSDSDIEVARAVVTLAAWKKGVMP